jgi:hypothetical protein
MLPSSKSELQFGSLEHWRAAMGNVPLGIRLAGLVIDDGRAETWQVWRWGRVFKCGQDFVPEGGFGGSGCPISERSASGIQRSIYETTGVMPFPLCIKAC